MKSIFDSNILNLRFTSIILLIFILSVAGCSGGDDSFALGGYILLEDNTPLEEIEVSFFWPEIETGPMVILTDTVGRYSYEYSVVFKDDRVTITPSHPSYNFLPTEYDFQNINGDNFELDFVAIPKKTLN